MASFKVGGSTLMLHAGASACDMDSVRAVRTPEATDSFCPIPHARLVDECMAALDLYGFNVVDQAHALMGDNGERYFGMLALEERTPRYMSERGRFILGLRNSSDKSIRASGILGKCLFVCDNMAWSGSGIEFSFARKHTTYALRDLPHLVHNRIRELPDAIQRREDFDNRMRLFDFSVHEEQDNIPQRMLLNDFLLRCVRRGAVTATMLPRVIEEFNRPDGPSGGAATEGAAWSRPTMWRLLQAVTEADKVRPSPLTVTRRHAIFTSLASDLMNSHPQQYGLPAATADLYYANA
jgi:hypothetical protein